MATLERLFRALDDSGVRFVVVGGLAMVLHGHARLTLDVDLVIDLAPEPARKAVAALTGLGYVPRVPVAAEDFANAELRETWRREKGMEVFSLWNPDDPMSVVDLFVHHPDRVRRAVGPLAASPARRGDGPHRFDRRPDPPQEARRATQGPGGHPFLEQILGEAGDAE